MGLFDRIFAVGSESEEEARGRADSYAGDGWKIDPAAREAMNRHHSVIEQRLNQQLATPAARAQSEQEAAWTAQAVARWDDHGGIDQVVGRLKAHSDPCVRALAARTLAMMPGRRAMEALAGALEDTDAMVRDAARDALIQLGVGTLLV